MWYRSDSSPGPDAGGTLTIDLKDGDNLSCCLGNKIYRLGRSTPWVVVNVGVRHRRQVSQVKS